MRNKPLTKGQRTLLLEAYLNGDIEKRRVLEKRFCVSQGLASTLARQNGHLVRPILSKVKLRRPAMWERARKIGALVR